MPGGGVYCLRDCHSFVTDPLSSKYPLQ